MAICPSCSSSVREGARFCDRCGADLSSGEGASTITTPERWPRRRPGARFVPGTVLDRRYRIVAPVGRGGMGEVYRADDLKLGQTVALKFLPQLLENDPERRELLMEEVKAARQVSHPNVCRVWDVGEADGLHFVAMEYVDGEDLGSLLRRIGRLPEDRGVQVAREICAGLAAIHDQGLVHRDLKPSNVMLDGRGHARITDFGLAANAEAVVGGDIRSGTPAYMAPETFDGREVTARSDIYSLGLVLYELFTGRHAFSSARAPTRRDAETRPEMPSSVVRSIDPVVERAIMRCLEINPNERPASATAVAQALPGGDPLAAAISLGETPSPGMVAAAGGVGGLSGLGAFGALAFSAAAVVGVLVLSEARGLPFGPDDRPYAALQDRASELMRAMGITTNSGQMQDGFSRMTATAVGSAPGATRNDVFYWQRRSPSALFPVVEERLFMGGSRFAIPALEGPGEAAARFDLQGRLLEFRRAPSTRDTGAAHTPDWGPLFSAAGIASRTPVGDPPRGPAPVPTDVRQVWAVPTPHGDRRVEGGAYRGNVMFFSVGPHYAPPSVGISSLIGATISGYVVLLLFAMSIIVARHNLKVGRADQRGAVRIGAAVLLLGLFGFAVFNGPRHPWPGSIVLVQAALGVFFSAFTATSYLALEPIVRRRQPRWLASWSRLLEGRWLDPLVGRHVVIGTMAGLTMALITGLRGYVTRTAAFGDFEAAAVGGWSALGVVCRAAVGGMQIGLVFALIFVLLRLAVRQDRFAFAVWVVWVLLYVTFTYGVSQVPSSIGLTLLQAGVAGLVLHRFGVLPMVVANGVWSALNEEYLTLHLGAWYAGVTVAALIAIAAGLAWGIAAGLRTTRDPRSA
jgi:serine/threonine-protein kinase